MRNKTVPILFLSLFLTTLLFSQEESKSGPVIKDFGKVWKIDDPDFELQKNVELKVVFDIMDSPESHQEINKKIETAARFLNMHAQSGVSSDQLKVALVVHHSASKDIMNNETYRKSYGVDNPNFELVKALLKVDAQIIFCGQSSKSRKIPKDNLIDDVQLALSAMTALIQLQNKGYRLIKF
ncbi:DsrE family protein [Ulvibacterium sp.]|uniref:DsrE family protein n=1 Tax=Ulvibacterium sp. TaxID=2665914 RepID=UPI003CC59D91